MPGGEYAASSLIQSLIVDTFLFNLKRFIPLHFHSSYNCSRGKSESYFEAINLDMHTLFKHSVSFTLFLVKVMISALCISTFYVFE